MSDSGTNTNSDSIKGRLLGSATNIRLGGKCVAATNVQVYTIVVLITTIKGFIEQVSGDANDSPLIHTQSGACIINL